MTERRLFPASMVDDITYCTDRAYANLSLNYAWIFTLEGEIDTDVFQRALDHTLDHYPKGKCILTNHYPSPKRWFRYCWEYTNTTANDILEEITWPDSHLTIEEAIKYYTSHHARFLMDLSSHVPLRVVLIRSAKRTFLFFIMHHAVADGLGGFFFIQKFITLYEAILYQRSLEPPGHSAFDAISIPDIRFRWAHFSPRYLLPYLKSFYLMQREPSLNLFPRKTARIISGKYDATVRQLTPLQLGNIRSTSKTYGATINDYLLAGMFQTIKKWSQEWMTQSDRIYITVPMNLRSPDDRTLTNILSGVNISLPIESIRNKEEMLPLIRQELATMVKNNLAQTLINFSSLLKPVPIPLRIPLVKHYAPGFAPSIVLSNMGILSPNPDHQDEEGFHYLGDARISEIHGLPAVGAWPMLLLFTYNNRVIFNLSFLNSYFSSETGRRFLDWFIREVIG